MKLFFDMEFTGLHQKTTPISIGIVSEDRRTFYAELNDYDQTQMNAWLADNVIANLKFNDQTEHFTTTRHKDNPIGANLYNGYSVEIKNNYANVAKELKRWLAQFGNEPILFVSDVCHYDFVLLCEFFGGALNLPANICPFCLDVNHLLGDAFMGDYHFAFDVNREEIFGINSKRKHNALHDAHIIRKVYDRFTKGTFTQKVKVTKRRGK